ncbi:MAG TPA: ABC transporter permease [Candidatus Dormibacteraeota bacterium]|jgi:peptide/nickel transport system permease protein|nr:ABC transporter permease [Candidatus Dormibacteraeota bacterium]
MLRFVLQRVGYGAVVIVLVGVVVFVVTHLVTNPVQAMLPLEASVAQRRALTHQLGLDRPLPAQFVDYVTHVGRLDFGTSLWQRRPALEIIGERLPYTLELVMVAMAVASALGLLLGVLAALRPGSPVDRLLVTLSVAGLSVPQFWLGLLLIVLFAVNLHWLPTSGTGDLRYLVLPVVTLAMPSIANLAMMVRSSMIDELNQQYVRFAVAKGLSRARVVGVHALRNASIPALTLAGWELIRALAGYTVVVEVVFGWPGLGHLAMDAIERQDITLLQAIVLVVAVMVVVINVAVDVLYKAIDPRVNLG